MLNWNPNKKFIVIDGIIGAGKTTLTKAIADKTGWIPYLEPVKSNPYLDDFYKVINGTKENNGEPVMMQIFLLNKRFEDHRNIIANNKNCLQDRTIWGDNIFAKNMYESGFISQLDYCTYLSLFNNMQRDLVAPSLIVYLDVSPKTARSRIHQRNRLAEQNINLEYLNNLSRSYNKWLTYMSQSTKIIRIPYDDIQLNDQTVSNIIEIIEQKHEERRQNHFLSKYTHLID